MKNLIDRKRSSLTGAAWLALLIVLSGCILRAGDALNVSEADARQALLKKVEPIYPTMARQMRIAGRVTVEASIDAEGKVEDCKPLTGNPLLTGAAVSAVKKWTFKPFTTDGKPTKAVTQLTFSFVP